MASETSGLMRCTSCKGMLNPSGREPYRFICAGCTRHFFVHLVVKEVPADDRPVLALPAGDEDAR